MPPRSQRTDRELPGIVWVAGFVALGVVVLLAVNVVHDLAMPSGHHDASGVLFRQGDEGTLGPLLSHRLVTVWQLNAVAVALCVLVAAGYLIGVARLRRRRPDVSWPLSHSLSFLAGLAVCVYATCGAVAVYDQALFTAHMLGHLCLVMLAPALIVLGRPLRLAVEASRPPTRARIERVVHSPVISLITSPPVAFASYAAVIVGSHLTGLMDTIMTVTWAGQVEHLVYLVVGYQFFALVLGDEPLRWQLSTLARCVMLAMSMAVDTFTGVVLLMSLEPIAMTPHAGLTVDALSDTRTGGAIMWMGGDGIMALFMIVLALSWLPTSGTTGRDRVSWLEQARAATLGERTGGSSGAGDLDEDDSRRAAYNAWLASVADSPPPGTSPRR
jgi:cytochrome c oxidase assembly factor CtaG